jgi:hypothetical protein
MSKEIKDENESKEPSSRKEAIDEDAEAKEFQEQELTNAKNLYKALQDPDAGPEVVKIIAAKLGLTIEGTTKKEQKETVKTIKDVVSQHLGTDFAIISDKLTAILEEVVPAIAENATKEIKERIANKDSEELKTKIGTALKTSYARYEEVPIKVQQKVFKLMEEMPPARGKTDPTEYFDRLLKIASDETGIKLKPITEGENTKEKEVKEEKRERNRRDASSRLASEGAAEVKDATAAPKEFKSRREMVKASMEEVEKSLTGKK